MAKRGLQFEVLVPAEVCVALVDPRTDNSPNNSVSRCPEFVVGGIDTDRGD
jgi:hypothetical protein